MHEVRGESAGIERIGQVVGVLRPNHRNVPTSFDSISQRKGGAGFEVPFSAFERSSSTEKGVPGRCPTAGL